MTDRISQRTPNRRLASLISEAGFSNAGLARRVDQLGVEHGLDLRYDKTSVTRWLRGQQPRGTTPALIAEVFTRRLGRRLSAEDLGLDACAPVYAGLEYAASAREAVDIVSALWRKDTGNQAELRKIAFSPAGLVVPSRDWLIGAADDAVTRTGPRVPAQSRGALAAAQDLRAAAPPTGSGRVGAGDIAAQRAVGDLFRTLDHAYGGGHARQALIRYLEHEAEPIRLDVNLNPTVGRIPQIQNTTPFPSEPGSYLHHVSTQSKAGLVSVVPKTISSIPSHPIPLTTRIQITRRQI